MFEIRQSKKKNVEGIVKNSNLYTKSEYIEMTTELYQRKPL